MPDQDRPELPHPQLSPNHYLNWTTEERLAAQEEYNFQEDLGGLAVGSQAEQERIDPRSYMDSKEAKKYDVLSESSYWRNISERREGGAAVRSAFRREISQRIVALGEEIDKITETTGQPPEADSRVMILHQAWRELGEKVQNFPFVASALNNQ